MGKMKLGKNVIEKKYGLLMINGEYFEETHKDGKPTFKKVNKKRINKVEKMAGEIAEKIKDSLDREKVIKESVMKLDLNDLEQLHNTVFNAKRKAKAKTREHHCVDMKVGNFILPIDCQ